MKGYKVIKPFGSAIKGDILEYDNETDLYMFDFTTEGGHRFMCMDEDTAGEFVEKGNLLFVSDEPTESEANEFANKLSKVVELTDNLIAKYDSELQDALQKYEKKEIPACMKVEAETVYSNLIKVLNKVKETANE